MDLLASVNLPTHVHTEGDLHVGVERLDRGEVLVFHLLGLDLLLKFPQVDLQSLTLLRHFLDSSMPQVVLFLLAYFPTRE